jgi:hypothetical protein
MIAAYLFLLAQSAPAAALAPATEHLLRFSYQAGSQQRVSIDASYQTKSTATSRVSLTLLRKVLEVKGKRAHVEMKLETLSFGEDDPRNAIFDRLSGAAWRGWVDERGRFEALTLVPPNKTPALLHPLIKRLSRLLPGRVIPLPEHALRVGDDWQISAKDLAASPDGSWAKAASGGLTCTLLSATERRAHISLKLDSPVDDKRRQTGTGNLVLDLRSGSVESFKMNSVLHMKTTIAGDTKPIALEQTYRLTSHPGAQL